MRIETKLALAAAVLLTGPAASCQKVVKAGTMNDSHYAAQRESMVSGQIESRKLRDRRVLAALRKVPRHLFVPKESRSNAYQDSPLPIGHGQTISQPYIVAYMSEALALKGDEKVLEIGTGSGYQAAILGELAKEVYTIEIVKPLAERSAALLEELGYRNVHVRFSDGYQGWPTQAPFDAIILTAAPPKLPKPLLEQLKVGGRLVAPVGAHSQDLIRLVRTRDGFKRETLLPVRFVPMTGKAQEDQ